MLRMGSLKQHMFAEKTKEERTEDPPTPTQTFRTFDGQFAAMSTPVAVTPSPFAHAYRDIHNDDLSPDLRTQQLIPQTCILSQLLGPKRFSARISIHTYFQI